MASVRDTHAVIAGMSPVAVLGQWHFCLLPPDDARCGWLRGVARATLAKEALTLLRARAEEGAKP